MSADLESNPSKNSTDPVQEVTSKVYYVPYDKLEALRGDRTTEAVDIYQLFRKVWEGKYIILAISLIMFFLGVFNAFFSTKQYQSYSLLIPEVGSATESRAEQLLRRYGSGLGIGSVTQVQEGVLPPMLFPNIVQSTPFQLTLLDTEIYFQSHGVKMTYRDFILNHQEPSPVDLVKRYTVGLPKVIVSAIIQLVSGDEEDETNSENASGTMETPFLKLSKIEQSLVDGLRSRINVSQNIENGLINTSVTLPDPVAAAEMNYVVVELLKQYITDYQLQKVREDLDFTTRMKEESEERFNEAQLNLADFLDRNKVLSTSKAKMELERLQDEKSLAFGIYNSVSQRLEQTKLALNEQRPTFKEVQPVTVPGKHSSPQRLKTIAVFLIIGLIAGVVWTLGREKINNAINQDYL